MNRRDIYSKFNGHCAYCGKIIEFDDMTIDHIVPLSQGGTNTFDNTIPSCLLCNNQKSSMSVEDFRLYIEHISDFLDENKPYRLAIRYKKVAPTAKKSKVTFYFEKR